jgi:hypothetical protein
MLAQYLYRCQYDDAWVPSAGMFLLAFGQYSGDKGVPAIAVIPIKPHV